MHDIALFQFESFRLQLCNFIMKLLHHRGLKNDFVKLFRTALTDNISLFVSSKKLVTLLTKQNDTWLAKALLFLTLNVTFPAGWAQHTKSFSQNHQMAFFVHHRAIHHKVFQKEMLTGIQKLAALKIHRKILINHCSFSKATCSKPKALYFATIEMLAILSYFCVSGNITVFTSFKTRALCISIYRLDLNRGGQPWFVTRVCSFVATFISSSSLIYQWFLFLFMPLLPCSLQRGHHCSTRITLGFMLLLIA